MERRVFAIHGSGKKPPATDLPTRFVSNFTTAAFASTIVRACEAVIANMEAEGWTEVEIHQAISRTGKEKVLIVDEEE